MKIGIASEHRGFDAKGTIIAQLMELSYEVIDFGPFNTEMCDYPDFGAKAAKAVSDGEIDQAILIGGTGIGMSIVANKFPGVRAALCQDDLTAEMSRRYNNANVLCLSANLFSSEVNGRMIQTWLNTPFEHGRHERRIAKITQYETEIHRSFEVCQKIDSQK